MLTTIISIRIENYIYVKIFWNQLYMFKMLKDFLKLSKVVKMIWLKKCMTSYSLKIIQRKKSKRQKTEGKVWSCV